MPQKSPARFFSGTAASIARSGLFSGRFFPGFMGLAMLYAIDWAAAERAFWMAVGQLVVIGVAGFVANILYKRYRDLSTARYP